MEDKLCVLRVVILLTSHPPLNSISDFMTRLRNKALERSNGKWQAIFNPELSGSVRG